MCVCVCVCVCQSVNDVFNVYCVVFSSDFQRLTLDTNTAHRDLSLSEDNRKVTERSGGQDPPDHPDRFDGEPQVLCTQSVTGRCSWEVECSGGVEIGVTDGTISRKGSGDDCRLGHNDQSWSLVCRHGNSYTVRHNSKQTDLPVRASSDSNRVAGFLDCPAGTLSFYTVFSDSLTHLYTFTHTFTEPLYAGFWFSSLSSSSVSLCEQR